MQVIQEVVFKKIRVENKYGYAGNVFIYKNKEMYFTIFATEWLFFAHTFYFSGNILEEFKDISIDYIWEKITSFLAGQGLRYTKKETETRKANFNEMFLIPFKKTLNKEVNNGE